MTKLLISFLLLSTLLFAENEQTFENIEEFKVDPKVDCLILQDENSIICKFEAPRSTEDQQIIVQWIDPQGDISRSREMFIPAGHGSIYDYRYIKGRLSGFWKFKVILSDKEYTTQFEIK